jgi:hypothetical protein
MAWRIIIRHYFVLVGVTLTLMLLSIEEVRTEFSVPTTRDLISTIRWKWAFKRFTSRPKKVTLFLLKNIKGQDIHKKIKF